MSANGSQVVLDLTVLNEAFDVVLGRWFTETFLPYSESSYDDMHVQMTIGPTSSDVDVDMVCDFAVGGEEVVPGVTAWSWEPFFGDNPFLAHEYRAFSSPALPYYGKFFHEGEPDEFPYTSVPTLWNLGAGEQLNLHFASAGMTFSAMEPGPADFPANIVVDPARSISLTGPLDLTAWSMAQYPDEWAATGGLVPTGAPAIVLHRND